MDSMRIERTSLTAKLISKYLTRCLKKKFGAEIQFDNIDLDIRVNEKGLATATAMITANTSVDQIDKILKDII